MAAEEEEPTNVEEGGQKKAPRKAAGAIRAGDETQEDKEVTARLLAHRETREKDQAARDLIMGGIKQNKFCQALDEKSVKDLSESMEYFVFKAGETVIKQGERGHHFFVCQDGELAVDVGGKAASTLGSGSAFGGISLLYNCPRTATVTAKGAASVWGGNGEVFRKVMKELSQKNFAENRKFLDCLRMFDGLSSKQKDRIGEMALYNETHDAGSRIFTEGEDPTALYFLKTGDATEWQGAAVGADGKISGGTQVATYSGGDVFGVKEVLLSEKRGTTVTAGAACELVAVGVAQLKTMLGEEFLTVLEQSFVLSVLKNVPVISQAGLNVTQCQKIVQAMQISNTEPGQSIGADVCLGVVIEGEVAGTAKTLRRGDWWEDEALAGAVQDGGQSAGPLKTSDLAASAGTRLATLRTQDLNDALQELGLSASAMNSAEVIDHMKKILLAKKVPIFRDLSEEQVNGLVTSLKLTRFKKGAKIFEQGEAGVNFYIVASGDVQISINGRVIRTLGTGTCFGERALLFNERRSATVEVVSEQAECWTIARGPFLSEVVTESMRAELIHRIELQDDTVTLKSLRHVKLIGAGAFGSVRLVEHKQKRVRYALKRVRKQEDPDGSGKLVVPDDVVTECDLLASMDHPFVLRLVRSFETANSLYILTELITGGQLFEQTNERMGVLSRKQAQFYVASLVCILEAVHGAGIVYRDLKPENVMLDERGFLKLVDFGLAKRLDPQTGRTFTACGTMLYMAPELIRGHGYGFEVDVWSLGVMFYELVTGQLPFGGDAEDEHELLGAILEDKLVFPPRYNDQQGKKLLQGMLEKSPSQRTGCGVNGWEEVKEHKYFKAGLSGNIFSKIIGHDIEAPVVPSEEQYSDERELAERGVTLSDSEELGQDSADDMVRDKVLGTFKRFDVNGDGTIDRSELQKLLQMLDAQTFCDENAEKLLDVVDTNKDGLIQFEEFLTWVVGSSGGEATAVRDLAQLDIHT